MFDGWPRRTLAAGLLLAALAAAVHQPAARTEGPAGRSGDVQLLAAAHDLAAGTRLIAADVRSAPVPRDLVPAGAVHLASEITGRIIAGAVRRGELLTDARLLGRGLAAGLTPPESVAVPVRLADAQTAALVRPGDRIDVLATPVDTGGGPVLPPGGGLGTSPGDGSGAAAAGPPGGAGSAPPPAAGSATTAPAGSAAEPARGGSALDATVLAAAVRVLAVLADPEATATDGALVVVAAPSGIARRLTAAAARQRLSVALRPP